MEKIRVPPLGPALHILQNITLKGYQQVSYLLYMVHYSSDNWLETVTTEKKTKYRTIYPFMHKWILPSGLIQ